MMRTDSDSGRPMAIPMKSRQSSSHGFDSRERNLDEITNPKWDHEAIL